MNPERFGTLVYAEARRRGLTHANRLVVLGDGAPCAGAELWGGETRASVCEAVVRRIGGCWGCDVPRGATRQRRFVTADWPHAGGRVKGRRRRSRRDTERSAAGQVDDAHGVDHDPGWSEGSESKGSATVRVTTAFKPLCVCPGSTSPTSRSNPTGWSWRSSSAAASWCAPSAVGHRRAPQLAAPPIDPEGVGPGGVEGRGARPAAAARLPPLPPGAGRSRPLRPAPVAVRRRLRMTLVH